MQDQQPKQQQQGQEIPMEEFVKETHITVGELLMQNRMANKIITKLQEENQALKQKMETKEITGLTPDDDGNKNPELNLDVTKPAPVPPVMKST